MSADINNVTQSQEMQDRLTFEVDSYNFTPDLCLDLASRTANVMELEANRHLFDVDFVPFSYIVAVTNPLKYQVPSSPACLPCRVADAGSFMAESRVHHLHLKRVTGRLPAPGGDVGHARSGTCSTDPEYQLLRLLALAHAWQCCWRRPQHALCMSRRVRQACRHCRRERLHAMCDQHRAHVCSASVLCRCGHGMLRLHR